MTKITLDSDQIIALGEAERVLESEFQDYDAVSIRMTFMYADGTISAVYTPSDRRTDFEIDLS